MTPPDDLVELGRIADAYGLKGWVSVLPESSDPVALLKSKVWWVSRVRKPGLEVAGAAGTSGAKGKTPSGGSARSRMADQSAGFDWIEVSIVSCKPHGGKLVAHFMGIEDRTLAEGFKGARVHVSRAKFPRTDSDEYYWVDLVGCRVVNLQGVDLGEVAQVSDHGAHAILEVKGQPKPNPEEPAPEHLIPFVDAYVQQVSLQDRTITVDWQEDY